MASKVESSENQSKSKLSVCLVKCWDCLAAKFRLGQKSHSVAAYHRYTNNNVSLAELFGQMYDLGQSMQYIVCYDCVSRQNVDVL